MKLIISGATGFLGTELVRQSMSNRKITSVVALARKPVPVPGGLAEDADTSKLKSIVVESYDKYSEEAKREFASAEACIWTVAITPTKSKMYDFEEVKHICQSCTLASLKTLNESGISKPFRFLYTSAAGVERDPAANTVRFYADYLRLRGETETKVLSLATELGGIEACIAKPGFITATGDIGRYIMGVTTKWIFGVPYINVAELATAMLDQAVNGFEKGTLMPEDLSRVASNISQNP
ncbi:putative nucleoside-diphosphate-sugar epimerase [Hypoxylon trugodes]|uniref:putative nucleoside-diphosphate-sugar epimerase n=1 Tax=Hypoxylon trugodes TaxID=326681 RepID=UPI00219DED1E|nr:putative nucleoside-diphosphate-sugar epimerase [Hypoxylon trugodes]KAI1388549.1 putative nucleoside-diphosphate-sugar epimerase [Hypoxylon trugodes]